MEVRLGYVAGPETIPNFSYCHNLTYTEFQKLGEDKGLLKLKNIFEQNLSHFEKVLRFNHQYGISFYRLSQNIVPLATREDVVFDFLKSYELEWKKIGSYIQKHQMRVDSHPDQFCVLNSKKDDVVEASKKILLFHASLFNIMNIEGKLVLHIGGGSENKEEAIERFKTVFQTLPSFIQKSIILENDDKVFTVPETLTLCQELHIPMVLDYHHYRCNRGKEKLESLLLSIFATWEDTNFPPKVHFSSPKNAKEFRSHSAYADYKSFLKFLFMMKKVYDGKVDVMLECKAKEEALFRLCRQLRFFEVGSFLTPTIFTI